jgi:hypothetical protein
MRPNSTTSSLSGCDLKDHNLAHKTFSDAATLDVAIHDAVAALNAERNHDPLAKLRISA